MTQVKQRPNLDDPERLDPHGKPSLTAGQYAHIVIGKQYHHMIQQEQGVLSDQDPEYLHQMRVGSRRLGAALLAFDGIVKLPKVAREKQIRTLTQALGRLRDLDVQLAAMRSDYCPRVNSAEQKSLGKAVTALDKQRHRAFVAVKRILTRSRYRHLKAAYEDWLEHPRYKSLAALPLHLLLPDLLSPLLSVLLLHPGWLISINEMTKTNSDILHDLRKVCKYVRYQAEFFSTFYDPEFKTWINELKELQDSLGKVQDIRTLQKLLSRRLSKKAALPELQEVIHQNQLQAMGNWETLRHKYLDPDYRYRLHQMILAPSMAFVEL